MESPLRGPKHHIPDPEFQLIETFGFYPDTGVPHPHLHMARLANSARHFGITFDPQGFTTLLAELTSETPLRCRMTLAQDGTLSMTTASLPESAAVWTFTIAETRLSSGDPYLRHKTTRRALYDQYRRDLPDSVDEVLFLNEKEELCEGTITNLLIETPAGDWLTPPLASGCLPGIGRQKLLDMQNVTERVLHLADLRTARRVRFVNALRGEIPAQWSAECHMQNS
ncbi:4-amino-4-deoxychorismate lyase [Epibacterium sp. SM1979]|uniref:Probable branched-chain-amino-acid aminotransferase n=1 Tax=Tritonibacter litoralis TaxID=2662264 RepID=A0A843YDL9_9RHOB|nr:aminotransferase class IV family protein [Tritonibacter litoralis]MQQ07948.1 4-amino-4-deoxychorismate lyase [Tritonibacter litoralis]